MGIDTRFWLQPGESLDTYRSRVQPLGGYGPTQQEVQSAAANLGSTGTRNLNISSGESAASLMRSGADASAVAQASPSVLFGQKLTELLKSYQTMGTAPFVNQQLNAQDAQAGRVMAETPQDLIGAAPSVQAGVRNAYAGALDPTIRGAQQGQQTFSEQIRSFGSAIDVARGFMQDLQTQERQKQTDAQKLIQESLTLLGGSAFEGADPKEVQQLEKLAGYNTGYISGMSKALKERELELKKSDEGVKSYQDLGNKIVGLDAKGNVVVTLPKEITGQDTPGGDYQERLQSMTVQSADDLLRRVSSETVGYGAMASFLPESPARDFANDLNTLKSSIGFSELVAMREASKTGGALGAISDREIVLLTSVLGGLDQYQSPESMKSNLKKIKDSIMRWNDAVGESSTNTSASGNITMTGPDGTKWNVPADKVEIFKQNGYKL